MNINTICVIGGGRMGRQIGLCAAIHGYKVTVYDLMPEVLADVQKWEDEYLAGRIAKGRMTEEEVAATRERFVLEGDLQKAAGDVDCIIECIIEVKEAKADLFRKLDGITNGLSDGFYAQNTTMLRGFADITTAVREGQFMAKDCCCETNRNIDGVRYDAQKNTCDIITAVHEEGEKTRSLIKENEIQVLRDKVAELQLAQSQCAQNAYLTNTIRPYPVPAYPACRPSCDGGWGWNYGGAA